jgi:hypothetical protein
MAARSRAGNAPEALLILLKVRDSLITTHQA